jgi:hypothetical protein
LAADFDRDGLLDLAVSNHSVDGDHHTHSKVYYNDGKRFSDPRITKLPTHGPHWGWGVDMGHIYNRSYEQFYESSVHHLERSCKQGTLSSSVELPAGTKLTMAVRSASTKEILHNKAWNTVSDGSFLINDEDRYLQYKVIFISENGDRYPVLNSVKIEMN